MLVLLVRLSASLLQQVQSGFELGYESLLEAPVFLEIVQLVAVVFCGPLLLISQDFDKWSHHVTELRSVKGSTSLA